MQAEQRAKAIQQEYKKTGYMKHYMALKLLNVDFLTLKTHLRLISSKDLILLNLVKDED